MDPDRRVVLLDTDAVAARETSGPHGISNHAEACIAAQILAAYRLAGVGEHQFGLISPYRAQLKVLVEAVKDVAPGITCLSPHV